MFSSFQKIILNRNHLALSGMQSSRSGVWREQAWGNNSETASQMLSPSRLLPAPGGLLPSRSRRGILRRDSGGFHVHNGQSRVLSSRGAQADGLQRNE